MERYYDLVMASTMAKYAKEEAGLDFPGTGFEHLPEKERWKKIKEVFYGGKLGVITEWGLVDFDPAEKATLVGGYNLTYDEYLDIQKESGHCRRTGFEMTYHDAAIATFKGRIERINTSKKLLCFKRIFISGMYPDGSRYVEKEDHVWMSLEGFEKYRVGDNLSFSADVYRYVKKNTGKGKLMDFGLRNPTSIKKTVEYELPSNDELRLQAVDQIICDTLCMHKEQCYGFCIANDEWLESMRCLLLHKDTDK